MFPKVTIPRITLGSRGQGQGSRWAPLPSPGRICPHPPSASEGALRPSVQMLLAFTQYVLGLRAAETANQWVPWVLPS